VEIAALRDPTSGTVHADGERDRPFFGWMELFSELAAAVSALRTRSGALTELEPVKPPDAALAAVPWRDKGQQ
jgi:hypothetical protein